MEGVYAEVYALTGQRVSTPGEARGALKAKMLAVHPDKLRAPGGDDNTEVFMAIRRCQTALETEERPAGPAVPVVPIYVPLPTLTHGGPVSFSVSASGGFEHVTVAVPPGTLPPARVVASTPDGGVIHVEIHDAPPAPGGGGARRVPGTLDAEVDWMLTTRDAIQHGEQASFDDALLGGAVVLDIPPYSPLCGAVSRPRVPFAGGGIVGASGARGDLFVCITVAGGVGLQAQECAEIAEQADAMGQLQRRCARAEATLNFYQEAYTTPPRQRRRTRANNP